MITAKLFLSTKTVWKESAPTKRVTQPTASSPTSAETVSNYWLKVTYGASTSCETSLTCVTCVTFVTFAKILMFKCRICGSVLGVNVRRIHSDLEQKKFNKLIKTELKKLFQGSTEYFVFRTEFGPATESTRRQRIFRGASESNVRFPKTFITGKFHYRWSKNYEN